MSIAEQKQRKRKLLAWVLVFSLLIGAFWFGRTKTQAATSGTISVGDITRDYTIEDSFTSYDGNTYYISNPDDIGDISVNDSGENYTISAPGTPKMDAHSFVQWQLRTSDGMVLGYAGAGETFCSSDGTEVLFTYDETDALTIEAEWQAVATVNYYADEEAYLSGTISIYSLYDLELDDGGGQLPLSITTGGMPDGEKVFLGWKEYVNYTHVAPNATVEYSEWTSLGSGYVASMVGTWLTPEYEFGDQTVTDYSGTVSVDTGDDYFTLYAPAEEPVAEGYFFSGWSVLLENTSYDVKSGSVVADAAGNTVELLYETYEDAMVTFTAEWQEIGWATAWFDPNGGAFDSGTDSIDEYYYQPSLEETTFAVTMLPAPEKAGAKFGGWQYTDAAGNEFLFAAGESTEGVLDFTYGTDQELMFTAKWIDLATVIYVSDSTYTPAKTLDFERQEGEDSITLNLENEGIVSDSEGGTFLAWYCDLLGNAYALPGTPITLEWDDIAGTTVYIMAKWLRDSYDLGEPGNVAFSGAYSVETADSTFTVTAPVAPKASGYLFQGWQAQFENVDEVFRADAGELLSSGGATAEFDYANYADQTLTFTALWEEAPVTKVAYYTSSEDYKTGAVAWSDSYMQEDGVEELSLTLPEYTYSDGFLLRWKDETFDGTYFPGDTLTYEWVSLADVVYEIAMTAEKLTLNVDMNDKGGSATAISVTDFSIERGEESFRLTIPETVPKRNGYVFSNWMVTLSEENVLLTPGESLELSYAEYGNAEFTLTALWKENKYATMEAKVISAGEVELLENQKYQFPEGTWKIEGDATIYEGGMEFFILNTGTYIITEGE